MRSIRSQEMFLRGVFLPLFVISVVFLVTVENSETCLLSRASRTRDAQRIPCMTQTLPGNQRDTILTLCNKGLSCERLVSGAIYHALEPRFEKVFDTPAIPNDYCYFTTRQKRHEIENERNLSTCWLYFAQFVCTTLSVLIGSSKRCNIRR